MAGIVAQLAESGFGLVSGLFTCAEIDLWRDEVDRLLAAEAPTEPAVLSHAGRPYAARNLLDAWPRVRDIARTPPLTQLLQEVLGPACGLVRGLLFDKPPEQTWSLPWHQDMTIAVKDNTISSEHFGKPTVKAGVPHVEGPLDLLERMVTARVHLDEVTDENGPLRVVAGSHRWGKSLRFAGDAREAGVDTHTILAKPGDVLLMRPLVAHSSPASHPDTQRHRRIVHLEFAPAGELPDGYEWYWFDRVA